jgi:hypothetical protein
MKHTVTIGKCRTVNALCLILTGFALTGVPRPSQSQQTSQQTTLQKVQSMKLPVADGKLKVYYAAGYENRISETRPLVEEAMDFYQKKLNVKEEFSIAILTREQWTKHLEGMPYGLPFVDERIAFFPATNDGVITAGAIAMKPNVSGMTLNKIKRCGFDFESGAMKFTDLIALHELGHVYVTAYGLKAPTKWLNEFLAQYFTHAFLKETHPKLADLFDAMATDVYIEGLKNPQHTSLEDFERLYSGVGADNYAWYQGKFLQEAVQIYAANKLKFFADIKNAFPLDEAGEIPPQVALKRLEKVNRDLARWGNSLN